MGGLRNAKHEAFAHELVNCQGNATEAYGIVYGVTGHVAEAAGSRLLKRVEVKRRFDVLLGKKSKTTLQTLTDQFDAVFDGAMGKAHFGAAGAATVAKAKLLGFMREQIEIGGPGSFADCRTPSDVVDKLVDENGSPAAAIEALRYVIDLLEERAATEARTIGDSAVSVLTHPGAYDERRVIPRRWPDRPRD